MPAPEYSIPEKSSVIPLYEELERIEGDLYNSSEIISIMFIDLANSTNMLNIMWI